MNKFHYKPIISKVEESYTEHTKLNIYEALGNIDFSKATLMVEAETQEEADKIRMGMTDIRMWELITE